jgi:hypothetical protein
MIAELVLNEEHAEQDCRPGDVGGVEAGKTKGAGLPSTSRTAVIDRVLIPSFLIHGSFVDQSV